MAMTGGGFCRRCSTQHPAPITQQPATVLVQVQLQLQLQLQARLLLWHFSGEWQPKREELLGS